MQIKATRKKIQNTKLIQFTFKSFFSKHCKFFLIGDYICWK